MKRQLSVLFLFLWAIGASFSAFGQKPLIPNNTDVFNLSLETHGSYNEKLTDVTDRDRFMLNNFNVEATGTILPWFTYGYRQVLSYQNDWVKGDDFGSYIEHAWVDFQVAEKFNFTVGKQDAAWGGFEYDEYPYRIYDYSDMNNWMSCYFTGLRVGFAPSETQEIAVQVTNSDERKKKPSFYNLGWNSSYLDELLSLRYSITAGQQGDSNWMWMVWAGQQVEVGNFWGYFDVMYTRGALDPLGLLGEQVPPADEENGNWVENTSYLSMVARLNYQFHPKWNAFVKGTYETASVYESNNEYEKGKYRTAWGYQGGIEFFPMEDDNLHLYLAASGKAYNLTDRAKALDASIDNTARLTLGFVYKIKLF